MAAGEKATVEGTRQGFCGSLRSQTIVYEGKRAGVNRSAMSSGVCCEFIRTLVEGFFWGWWWMDRMADLAYDRSKRAREHEHIMQEDGGVKVRVEISAWEEVVVFDAVGHCLLVGVGEKTWGGFGEREEEGSGFWEVLGGFCWDVGVGVGTVVAAGSGSALD